MKLIRECRMGPPKSFKTGAILGTYPKPLLYLQFDREGASVIPWKGAPLLPGNIPLDVTYDEITTIQSHELAAWLAKPMAEQPKILVVDFTLSQVTDLDLAMKPAAFTQPRANFIAAYNNVSAHIRGGKPLPWKTAVLDSVGGYESIILNYISATNPAAMADARQWAGQVGGAVKQTILSMTGWPCHVVFIAHSQLDKNELTGQLTEMPNVFSKLRDDIGGLFSQFFYAVKNGSGEPIIWPHPQMYVRGIGARWPSNLGKEVKPDFKSIYGVEAE